MKDIRNKLHEDMNILEKNYKDIIKDLNYDYNYNKNEIKEKDIMEEKDDEKMNYLMSQISPYKEDDKNQLIPEKENNYDSDNYINSIPSKEETHKKYGISIISTNDNNEINPSRTPSKYLNYKNNKKVTFDDNLIYINYDEDEYVTNVFISDNNGRNLPHKGKDFSKYLRILTSVSHTSKLKPILIDANKKRKNKKKTKIMKRNIEFLKKVAQTGNVYDTSKERSKKKYHFENMKGCKKFFENPQQFFTEELCDAVLLSYNLDPKENRSRSSSKKKSKDKK